VPYLDYLTPLRRRWWLPMALAIVAAVVAFTLSSFQAPVFRATARLLVSPGRPDLSQQFTIEKQLRPMAQRVRTTEVARQVEQDERLDLGADRLLGIVRAEAVIDQGLIQVEVDDSDPRRAERIAAAFAQVFAQQHAAADIGKPQADRLYVDVLDRPTSASQIAPQSRVTALAAGLVGLVAGILLALGLEYADNTLKTPNDVERVLGLPTLARIPRTSPASATTAGQPASLARRGEPGVS
jgi:capsular polysaccharide biosynthesis protein